MERIFNRENHVFPQIFMPENCSNKPYLKEEFGFVETPSPKGYLDEFQHLEHRFHGIGSSSNPMFHVQTGSSYVPFDAFPYGSSTDMELYDEYDEHKPFADDDHANGERGNVMGNFKGEGAAGNLMNRLPQRINIPIDVVGISSERSHMSLNYLQEMKSANDYGLTDEISSARSAKHDYYKKDGFNKNRLLPTSTRSWKCRKKSNVVKGQWTIEEDRILIHMVEKYGLRKWSHIAQMLPGRIGKQCRERWHNHLRPDIKKETWTDDEDKALIEAHIEIGNKWAEIAKRLPGRTENSIKNHWNATKRREFSKRKCRSKYPRGILLQEYIRSLNLDSSSNRRNKGKASLAMESSPNESRALLLSENDQLVPDYDYFREVPDLEFEDKTFQDGCSIEDIIDEMPCSSFGEIKSSEMDVPVKDVTPPRDFQMKKEIDLMEMIYQAKV